MSSAQFLRHKITGIKYLRTAAGAMMPVADLPRQAGRAAGHGVNLNRSAGALNSTRRALA